MEWSFLPGPMLCCVPEYDATLKVLSSHPECTNGGTSKMLGQPDKMEGDNLILHPGGLQEIPSCFMLWISAYAPSYDMATLA